MHTSSSPDSASLVCLVGPTGTGKTAAALALADILPVSVINADSRQIYRDFPIATAQPSEEERSRCPHVLYGFVSTEDALGAGEYARLAGEEIEEVQTRGRLPVLVGGTGLYLRALLEGIAPIPEIPSQIREYWQQRCREEGSAELYSLLAEYDPVYAAKIHPNDRQRITRALEVRETTGKNFSCWHAAPLSGPARPALKAGISLPLPELEPLLDRRIDLMMQAGALDEAREALRRCPDPAPGWSGIGCAELRSHLLGETSFDECRSLWLKNTRAYAKRQLTWFRADREIRWFSPNRTEELVEYIAEGLNL